jgi:hypothetical protein
LLLKLIAKDSVADWLDWDCAKICRWSSILIGTWNIGKGFMRNDLVWKIKQAVSTGFLFRLPLSIWFGTKFSYHYFIRPVWWPYFTILRNGEFSNFTYQLTDENLLYLAETLAVVTGKSPQEMTTYILEPIQDEKLISHLRSAMAKGKRKGATQSVEMPFGRRLGWYAIVRSMKPRVIVETGVERGHGSILLCSALLRNEKEGMPGRYFGTDINPNAGWLLSGEYAAVGRILYGDSIKSLNEITETIDLFINDSDHSDIYEAAEYEVIREKLSENAIILGDNAHVTDKLARFARQTGRQFLFFKEHPRNHWYPGGGIGFAFPKKM